MENPAFKKDSVDEEPSEELKYDKTNMEISPCRSVSDYQQLREARSIRWNIILIAICSLLVTSPTTALVSSTTSLLGKGDLGITSLTASSVSKFLGATFLLVYLNKILGMRKMVTITIVLQVAFTLSFFYPSWGTTFPAAILLGLGLASVSSVIMYGSALGYYYARITKGNAETILVAITAFLTTSHGTGFVLGNGILFAVLGVGNEQDNFTVSDNNTYSMCGAEYCNEDLKDMIAVKKSGAVKKYTLIGIFASMAILGGILSLFVRNFADELGINLRKKTEYFIILKETLGLLSSPRGYLLIFLSIFTGLDEAFRTSTYTHAYVSCTVGIAKVGLIMMAYGGTHTLVCLSLGFLVRIFGRFPLIVLAICLHVGCSIALLLWHPQPDHYRILFIVIVIWGACSAIIVPSLFAMYGILFKENIEGALSLGSFWRAVGYMMAFLWSQVFCVRLKLYITMAFGILGLFFYVLLEIMTRKNARTLKPTDNPDG